MPCVILCFKAVCCSLCPICSAASMALTLRQTLSTTAGCRICRRKDAWHFMALGKSMLMCMPELAFLLVPEATCNNTEAGTANAISTTSDYSLHGNHQDLACKRWYGRRHLYQIWLSFFSADIKLSHTALGAGPNALYHTVSMFFVAGM